MKTNYQKILDFHASFDEITGRPDGVLPFRLRLMSEEWKEVAEALQEVLDVPQPGEANRKAKAHLVKELCDVLSSTYGTLAVMGVDADAAFEEVFASNMTKTPDRENHKAIKGPNYRPAEMLKFVKEENV